jgi:uncharacterized protein YgiB involved in biofilm formation
MTIALVLMGGGALAAAAIIPNLKRTDPACEQARASNLPNAEEICARTTRSSSSSSRSSWHSAAGRATSSAIGSTATSRTSSISTSSSVSRGGFGSTGLSFSSGS